MPPSTPDATSPLASRRPSRVPPEDPAVSPNATLAPRYIFMSSYPPGTRHLSLLIITFIVIVIIIIIFFFFFFFFLRATRGRG